MDFEEFKYLINRITLLSDKCAGLKTQNKILEKKIATLEFEKQQLDFQNQQLAEKVTKLNHDLQKYQKEHETPAGVHGRINITGKKVKKYE